MYAVIFSSKRKGSNDGYDEMADKMDALSRTQAGFISIESVRGDDGFGITVCVWETLAAIKAWKLNLEHQEARRLGHEKWYESYHVRVCKIEEEYSW